jgi:hypothetical protein
MTILNERGAYLTRILEDGRVIDVVPLSFQRARITISADIEARAWDDGF